jgi:hypothetical protein
MVSIFNSIENLQFAQVRLNALGHEGWRVVGVHTADLKNQVIWTLERQVRS